MENKAESKTKTVKKSSDKKGAGTVVTRGCTYAEQRNWEQRVKTETESGDRWKETWGEYFDVPSSAEKIHQLEEEVKASVGIRLTTENSNYGSGSVLTEIRLNQSRSVDQVAKEIMARMT